MHLRLPTIALSAFAFLLAVSFADANSRTLGFANRRAKSVENKRVEKQLWAQPKTNSMSNQSFPIKEWDKHFSSVGSKRAPIAMREGKQKQMYRTKKFESQEVEFDMSRWNERMKDLHQQAGIKMDGRAQLVADRRLYSMLLQDTTQFRDMAEELSLREINRYQFRRNRTDDGVPVEQAGKEK